MTNVGTIVAGYGIAIVTVAFYAAWIVTRGRQIGSELGIGAEQPTDGPSEVPAESAEPTDGPTVGAS